MSRKWSVSVALLLFVSAALASNVPRLSGESRWSRRAAEVSDCDSQEPCVRVYKTNKDIESQSYKVVRFREEEITNAAVENARRIHNKIVDETGFNCKKAEYKYGVFNCEEGALYATHDLLITVLRQLYSG